MRFNKYNKHLKFIYPLLLLVIFALVYQIIFDTKIDTGGDNAYYYILGQSISTEKSYTNTHHIASEKHYHYPPGYPVLIAAIDSFNPNNTIAIKVL